MPVWRLQTSVQMDTAFAKDRIVLTPHFDDHGVTTDPTQLCADLAALTDSAFTLTGEVKVSAYDAQGTPPVYPAGEAVVNEGVTQTSSGPRELAICLSFYSERNLPRQRGRLFIPAIWCGVGFTVRPPTPPAAIQTYAEGLAALGGLDVDWVVWSRTDAAARKVSQWWVDNEWDVVRSRGLTPTGRFQDATSG